jgi:predicted dithiol-disulfide oxidoreductase (DUF899 family)
MTSAIQGVLLTEHRVVAHSDWIEARKQLLVQEKEFTRLRDALSRQRRDLPWEAVDKKYVFDGPNGQQTLAELFDGRSQLIVYHFMFDPEWDEGCPHCSFWADNFNPIIVHLNALDVTMIAVSRAPFSKIAFYQQRMGWDFHWVSSIANDFNGDLGVSFPSAEPMKSEVAYNYTLQKTPALEREGMSVFVMDENGDIFHTYSAYARGIDIFNTAYNYLDVVPRGRQEDGQQPQWWVRRHDEYPG